MRHLWKPHGYIALTVLLLLSGNSMASSITSDTLISNCQELIAIYDKKGEQRFLAGMSTSVAEAMRAGICRGMIEEHINHAMKEENSYYGGCSASWYSMASTIAEMKPYSDAEAVLEAACGNW